VDMTESENVHVLEGPLEVHGVVKARAFLQFSDLRLKTNINDIVDALDIVSNLQGKTYEWKKGTLVGDSGGKRVIGLIAQEVQRILPEVVTQDPKTGLLSVSYAEIVPVLIEAFKEHLTRYQHDKQDIQEQIEDLRGKLDRIQAENRTLRPRMSTFFNPTPQTMYLPPQPIFIHSNRSSLQAGPATMPGAVGLPKNIGATQPVQVVQTTCPPAVIVSPRPFPTKQKSSGAPILTTIFLIIGIVLLVVAFVTLQKDKTRATRIPPAFIPLVLIGTLFLLAGFICLCIFRRAAKSKPKEGTDPDNTLIPPAGPQQITVVAV